MADLSKMTCIEDLRQVAECRVPRMFYDYADSGSWTEGTYRANESDFHAIKFRQRVAVNMEGRSTAATMVGQQAKMPVCIAPVGLTGMQHADGEIHAARAAEKFGIPFTLSTMSICSIEDIAEHTSAPFWFQLYMMRDRDAMARMIQRAKDAKCSALVLTLDLQVIGQRHKDIKNGLTAPPRPTIANIINLMTKPRWCLGMAGTRRHTFRNLVGHVKGVSDMNSLAAWTNEQFDPRLSWEDVRWVKQQWGGKLILKGIMEVEDALLAAQNGADAIVVSNHGGRQLDGAPSSIAALPAIVDAVGRPAGGVDGRRHPKRPGRAARLGSWSARHHDRPRHGLWPGRLWRGRRDQGPANHPQGAGREHGLLRPHRHPDRGSVHPRARYLSEGAAGLRSLLF